MSEADGRRTSRDKRKEEMVGTAVTASALPDGASTSALQTANNTLVGAVNESAPGTDTASSGLNGRLQRIAQRITTAIASLVSIDGKLPALVTGRVPVDGSGVTQPVSGTFWQATQPVSLASVPTHAVTQSGTWTVTGAGGTFPVTDNSGSLTVDAPVGTPVYVRQSDGLTGAQMTSDQLSRLNIAYPSVEFEAGFRYNLDLLKWDTSTTGGSAAHVATDSAVRLSTGGTTSGNNTWIVARKHMQHRFGQSKLVLMSFKLETTAETNEQSNVGIAITSGTSVLENAVLFRRGASGSIQFIVVSDQSGSAVSDAVNQSSWNLDKLNGTGASGYTLNFAYPQTLAIELDWPTGRTRLGFVIAGKIVWAHEYLHANSSSYTTTYMRTAHLSPFFSVRNHGGATSAAITMLAYSAVVMTTGADNVLPAYHFTHNTGTTTIAVTTRRPVLSIRTKTTGPNSIRNTGFMIPNRAMIYPTTNGCLYELVLNGSLTGASWAAVDSTYSIADKDTSATAISGGVILASGYAFTGAPETIGQTLDRMFPKELDLVYSNRGSTQDTLSIVCTAKTGTSDILASIDWTEVGV